MQVALAQINPTVGDLDGNLKQILSAIDSSRSQGADIVLFPELALSGYPPEDFLLMPHFIDACHDALQKIVEASSDLAVVVGLPRRNPDANEKPLFNSAAVIQDGVLLGFYDKHLLPTYDVFDERRYFEPGKKVSLWALAGHKVAVSICEDMWRDAEYSADPMDALQSLKPDLLLNLSSSPYHYNKIAKRTVVCQKAAKTLGCPVFLCNQVGGNDSLIFDGYSLHVDGEGKLVTSSKGFDSDLVLTSVNRIGGGVDLMLEPMDGLYQALVLGLRDYFRKLGFSKACLGLSGGIDSAVVACIAAEALGPENVLAISMPSRYSSEHSVTDAERLASNLGIQYKNISIESSFQSYLDLMGPHFEGCEPNETEENLQARVRGMILMAFSNKFGYIVLSPGNKSEIALGYCTLYGDTCGGLGVINDVVKTRVYGLAEWINRDREIIPDHIITKPPSAELRPDQKDTDSLPEYDIVDAVLADYVEQHLSPEQISQNRGFDLSLVQSLVQKIHRNEYKRVQMPPGLRVTERAFSKGRRFPIVQRWVP